MTKRLEKARKEAEKRGIGGYERHIFLCIGPDCCTPKEGEEAWGQLKKRTAQLNGSSDSGRVYRTKVGCLRICVDGPTLVVYPEGTWYHGMTAERIPRFVQEHLVENKPVEEWIFARNPLGS